MEIINVNSPERAKTTIRKDRDPASGYALRELKPVEEHGVERGGFSVIKGSNLVNVRAGFCVRKEDGSYALEPGVADLSDVRVRPTEDAKTVGSGLLRQALAEAKGRGFGIARAEVASADVVGMIDAAQDSTTEVRLFDEPAGAAIHTAELLEGGYEVTEQEAQEKLLDPSSPSTAVMATPDALPEGGVSAVVLL